MSHLHTDRLAALADEQPTAEERAHLDSCAECAEEVAAHQAVHEMAMNDRDAIGLPLTRWENISARLQSEGLTNGTPLRRTGSQRGIMQAAAALLLVAGGAVAGRVSAGGSPLPDGRSVAVASASSDTKNTKNKLASMLEENGPTTFGSIEEAKQARTRFEAAYQNASAWLASNDTASASSTSPATMRTRLAALDRVSSTMRQAMEDAPYDPVINGYYLTTLGQREATIRQINTALPAGARLNSF
ncbi:MAG: hypothetical protein JWO05_1567 [Gemmatimonadetes bacterium]|nr:hypothetical protein [Gemmatimonadota bacterium]